ncbi:50S ribosomal protein L21 [Alphaproteobacteria bacterium]|nr:50S ribosomal protein L21 [Alphaproteobacteria bacterium]
MYAVVKTGGKQYRVEKNDVVLVEKLNANDGDQVVLGDVLMLGEGKKITLGNPLVNDAAVMAQVVRQTRGPKITMIYKRRRKNSRRKQGHKQDLTLLKIVDIAETGGLKLTPKKAVTKATQSKAKAVETKSKTSGTKAKVEKKAESTTANTKVETKTKSTTAKAKVENKTKTDTKPKKSTTKDK